ncbi:MAG TPA: SgcJ/EcaC family oxidoreductase [Gammaproteobacteria bacterium]|nr:SgcJ/EcaC family oxidoreductase [Gammaproteobacteria bacterium]
MQNDEQDIRELISTWLAASKAGDTEKVLSLITDDVVFLVAGQPASVMRKADFAAALQAQAGPDAPEIEGSSDIQEIKVLGDWAFLWQKLSVTMTPPGDAKPMTRAGYTLTIVRKEGGKWKLARDANMLGTTET